MAYYDCDFKEVDILEVKSVSDMISAFKTSAADAAKLMGGDDIAVFSPRLGLMAATSQYDLEEPVTTSQTVVFSVDDAQCKWPDPPEYISDIVFELRGPSGARLATEFQTFSDENATPSASLEYYRKRFAESGACTVFSGCDAKYLLDLKGKRDASRADIQDGTLVAGKRPADGKARPTTWHIAPRAPRGAAISRWKMPPPISYATDFRRFPMFMYAVKKPAAAAAAALGEDGTAVFCEGPGLLFASARGETPDAGITTAIFNDVEKGDIHDGDRWFPGAGSIAEVVFDMPAPLGEKLAGRLEGSVFLIDYFRDKIASLGEECDVITGTNIHVGLPAQLEMPAPHAETKPSDEMRCPVLEIEPCEIRAPYIVAKEAAAAAKRGTRADEDGERPARTKGGSL